MDSPLMVGRFFALNEFRCRGWENREHGRKCCCRGAVKYDPVLVSVLDVVRESVFRGPVIVLNGFRCEAYNASVGGYGKSEHPEGRAADLFVSPMSTSPPNLPQRHLQSVAERIGIILLATLPPGRGNVIYYTAPGRNFIHVDVGARSGDTMVRESTALPKVAGRH